MMSIQVIFEQAKGKDVALVRDKHILYLVLNKPDNVFDFDSMKMINECLDQVEATEGAACLVTIGTGDKIFSTGFNLQMWSSNIIAQWQSILIAQKMFDRFLTLAIPTLCVMNGITIAGGLLLSLVHDFRIIKENKSFICLSELNIGVAIPPGLASIVKQQLDPQIARKLVFGGRFSALQALQMKIVDNTYNSTEQLQAQIQSFADNYASKGVHRIALKDFKENIHNEAHMKLMFDGFTYQSILGAKPFDLSILKSKL